MGAGDCDRAALAFFPPITSVRHSTLLLDRGLPVHWVADRIGDDPAVLLRNYAKRKRRRGDKPTTDAAMAEAIAALGAGILGR